MCAGEKPADARESLHSAAGGAGSAARDGSDAGETSAAGMVRRNSARYIYNDPICMQMAAYRTDLFHSYVTEGSIRCPVPASSPFLRQPRVCVSRPSFAVRDTRKPSRDLRRYTHDVHRTDAHRDNTSITRNAVVTCASVRVEGGIRRYSANLDG